MKRALYANAEAQPMDNNEKMYVEKKFYEFKNLIHDICHKLAGKSKFTHDDLFSKAMEYFITAVRVHNKESAGLSTWVRFYVYNQLCHYIYAGKKNKTTHYSITKEEIFNKVNNTTYNTEKEVFELMEDVSSDAKAILRLIFDAPQGLQFMVLKKEKPRITKQDIKEFLYKKGIKRNTIYRAFDEIKEYNG